MKKGKFVYGVVLLLLVGCAGAGPVSDIFIADVSNVWKSSRNSTFFFNPDKIGVNAANFTGEEDDDSGNTNTLTGSFLNYDIQFKFTSGDEAGETYSGKFVKGSNPLRMVVKNSKGVSLTITKNL